jgi:hypothetical protein
MLIVRRVWRRQVDCEVAVMAVSPS